YDMSSYFVASAADEILIQPGGIVATVGLVQQQTFLRDALDTIGLKADSVAISPYKSAVDALTRRDPSPEEAAMTNWLLDSRFEILVDGIAQGRKQTAEAIKAMINGSPHTDVEAREAGFVDAIVGEEGLYDHLGTEHIMLWEQANG